MISETDNKDTRVFEAYRSGATETTPPELDDAILRMAASKAPTRYGLARGWLRPLGWAATIGLSLALVLEISQFQDIPVVAKPETEMLKERVVSDDMALKPQDADIVRRKLNKHTGAASPAKARVEYTESAAPAAMDSAAQRQEVASDGAGPVHEAEEQVRMRASGARLTALPDQKRAHSEYCDEDARRTAKSWYTCIEKLKDEGLTDAAKQELDALLAKFPEFREPDPDR